MKTDKKPKPQCVAPALMADPEYCWVATDCKYYNAVEQRCDYVQRHAAELERARDENKPAGIREGGITNVAADT